MKEKKHKLGLWMLTALVSGNMIGSGVFMLPADLARVGSISLIAWVCTACGAFFLAMVFAKMGAMIPKNGGPYAYAQAAFGDFVGFQTAYNYWIALWVGNAGIVVALMGYLRVFLPGLGQNPWLEAVTAIAIIWLLTFVNSRNIRQAGIVQLVTTILKFLPLGIIAVLGWRYFHPDYLTHNFNLTGKSHLSAFSTATILTFWTFVGVESATIPADLVENPQRNIPLATLFGTVIAAVVYISSGTALMGMLPQAILAASTSPFAAASKLIFGQWGEWFIAAGALISCFGALNGWILLQGQVPMAAALDNLFPRIFAKKNRFGIPTAGLYLSSICITGLLLLTVSPNLIKQFELLILIASVTSLLAYFYTAIAEIILLPCQRAAANAKKTTINMVIAAIAAAYSFWAIFSSGRDVIFYIAMIIFSSIPLYAWIFYKKNK